MNPTKQIDRTRLSKAISKRYRDLHGARERRRSQIADVAGSKYGREMGLGLQQKTLINLCQLLATSLSTALVGGKPRFKVIPDSVEFKAQAARNQKNLNEYAKKLYLHKILRKVVNDSLYGMGIGKVFYGDKVFDRVSFDDVSFDTSTDLYRCSFFSDRYRIPLEDAKNDEQNDEKVTKELRATLKSDREDSSLLTSSMTSGVDDEEGEIDPMVDLCDVWVRREKKVYRFAVQSQFRIREDLQPLAVIDWPETHELGPYRDVCLIEIPDNSLPVSPFDSVQDLFRIINILLVRLTTRAKKMRDIPYYKGGAGQEDMQRLMTAPDLAPVAVSDKDNIGLMKLFGLDPALQQFLGVLIEMFKQGSGNLDQLAGLSPAAETLGQQEMIAGQVNQRIALYREKVNEFTSSIGGDLLEFMWTSKTLEINTMTEVQGTPFAYDSSWLPPHRQPREGRLANFGTCVEPYSLAYMPPQMRLQTIRAALQQDILPLMPLIEAKGGQFDVQEYLGIVADLSDIPEISRLVQFTGMPPADPNAAEQQNQSSTNGPHEYIHKSQSNGPSSSGALNMALQHAGGDGASAMQLE